METDTRKKQIIKAALKRFSHFGVAKTTMNEIADDSSITKGNIYYYFTDKNALIAEVIKELLNQYDKVLKKRLMNSTSTLHSLQLALSSSKEFFEKYYMINLFENIDCSTGNDSLKHVSDMAGDYGHQLIIKIFTTGIERGELQINNVEETAQLYNDASRGIFFVNRTWSTKTITIDYDLMNVIHNKQMELAKIFITALTIKTTE